MILKLKVTYIFNGLVELEWMIIGLNPNFTELSVCGQGVGHENIETLS